MNMTNDNLPKFENILSKIVELSGLLLILSAVGYFIGWKINSSYFDAIGAPWAIAIMSPMNFLQSSYWFLAIFILFTYVFIISHLVDKVSTAVYALISLITLALGLMVPVAFELDYFSMQDNYEYIILNISAYLIVISAAATCAELFSSFSNKTKKLSGYKFTLITWILILLLTTAPNHIGRASAALLTTKNVLSLPLVCKSENAELNGWRLLHASQERALLVSNNSVNDELFFRIIPIDKMQCITQNYKFKSK